jgi:hypothetical protein
MDDPVDASEKFRLSLSLLSGLVILEGDQTMAKLKVRGAVKMGSPGSV